MADARLVDDYTGYLDAASAILGVHDGRAAEDAFGLADALAGEDGHVDLAPALAFLEAQGRTGRCTSALALLGLAGVVLPDAVGRRVLASSFGRGGLLALPGGVDGAVVVVDVPGTGLVVHDDPAPLRQGDASADDGLVFLVPPADTADLLLAEPAAADLRDQLLARTRLGASAELLGLTRRVFDDALAHARRRRQFGNPIGSYQAVQHLLAWASTDLHQLQCLFDVAALQAARGPLDPELARTVKALAGRVLHGVVQTAVQVTGAISFTWEYSLNQLQHRGLALDQLAGSSADLVVEIGRQVRTRGSVPELLSLPALSDGR